MRLNAAIIALLALAGLAVPGCGEPQSPAKDPQPTTTPAPIPSTPTPHVDNQVPAAGQVHAAPTPADTSASSTHATPAPVSTPSATPEPTLTPPGNPTPAPAENPGTGNAK